MHSCILSIVIEINLYTLDMIYDRSVFCNIVCTQMLKYHISINVEYSMIMIYHGLSCVDT